MSSIYHCRYCGAKTQPDAFFCSRCRRQLVGGPAESTTLPLLISPARIVVMCILSFGFYTLYWFYKTWRHYKEHTGARAYPVWHGLSLLVPVYGAFRAHAHMRSFAERATALGVPTRLSPDYALGVVLSGTFGVPMLLLIKPGIALIAGFIIAGFVALVWMMLQAQSGINTYWQHVWGGRLKSAPVGAGEILLMISGPLIWGFLMLASLYTILVIKFSLE